MKTSLDESRLLRLLTFTVLYFAQGVPWGFIATGYGVLLTDLGLDAAAIGAAIGLAYLPWSFKILWGPLLDAVPLLRIGRRRPFIVFAQLVMGLTMLALYSVDPRVSMPTVTALLFLNNTFAALQDVAVDALAVDLLREDERGRANSLMWAGKSLGVALGGGGGMLIAKVAGWGALFVGIAVVIWLVMLIPLVLRERPPGPEDRPVDGSLLRLGWFLIPFAVVGALMYGLSVLEGRYEGRPWAALIPVAQPFVAVLGAIAAWPLVDRDGFRAMRRSFSFPTPWWALLAGILMPSGYAMIGAAQTKLLRGDLHLTENQMASLSGMIDPLSGVVGALIGGVVADRLGVRRTIAALMGGIGACLLVFGLGSSLWPQFVFLAVWTACFNGLVNAFSAATLGLYMSVSNPRIGATHFAVYMAATNLTYAWTAPFGGMIADRWGYAALFVVAAIFQVATIPLLIPIDARRSAIAYRQG